MAMDWRVRVLTKHLKEHDPELFARRAQGGAICVYRKAIRWEAYQMDEGALYYSRPSPHFVFALTDNWTAQGRPIDWGIEPVIQRAKEHHYSRNQELTEQLIKEYEAAAASKERHLKSEAEAFAGEFRKPFAKAFNDFNVSSLSK